jgi:hypothetical protein
LYRNAASDLQQFPDAQQIWHSNSAMSAEETMVPKADELLIKFVHPNGKKSVAMSFTGSDGLILKTALMAAFTNFDSLDAMTMELFVCCAFRSLSERSPSTPASAVTLSSSSNRRIYLETCMTLYKNSEEPIVCSVISTVALRCIWTTTAALVSF